MKQECPQCKGEGYVRVSLDGAMKCGACQGSGCKEEEKDEVFLVILENDFGRDTVVAVRKDRQVAIDLMNEKDDYCKDNGFPYGHRVERHDVK
ncbi:hypothetical protein BigBertha_136 [Bacillus phage BigBertha]|uniref:Uncharacterized protein n=4 Tax=Caudoviricetes TaxID=2731619 RepID=A0A7U3T8Q2_9CAUD|nr:hypothetical protein BigBertha_136 [Bacillus phage BigBertha]AGY46644.1 hypothetical protein BigBertha_136 [Bacillus phage BigBertha]AMW61665.1 hypothetical protein JUGLONE_140 [Bacillus phage Juglone]QPY77373.1 hypothetical protein ANTHOS_137 [Bacillus phage Anthos]